MKSIKISRVGRGSGIKFTQHARDRFKFQSLNFGNFLSGIKSAFLNLSRKEKALFFIFLSVLLVLVIFESIKIYHSCTKLVPAKGGEYVEVALGDAKYFNPVLAKTDAEKSISRLIYSSLIKIDSQNNLVPDLATSWEISEDGLNYTFHLRSGVTFQDGKPLDSSDVAATIAAIQDDNNKSYLSEAWKGIEVETPDPDTAIFKLPKSYGPFIYNCTLGIVDSVNGIASLTGDYNGTGPYKYLQSVSDSAGNLVVTLEANEAYYAGVPMVSKMKFIIAGDSQNKFNEALKDNKGVTAVFSGKGESSNFSDISFTTDRSLVLFFNLRHDVLKSAETRKAIIDKNISQNPLELKLLALDIEPQKTKARELSDELNAKNYKVNFVLQDSDNFSQSLAAHDYDLLLYGYSWKYDRDPYIFWHSSQLDKMNFDGYSDKNTDIAIEDARMIVSIPDRNAKYDQIYQKISEQSLAVYYNPENFKYFISSDLRGVTKYSKLARPEDRFNDILSWYLVEKRVRK